MRADFEAILREAGTASDLGEVLAIIVRRVKDALSVDVCAVCLTDAASGQLAGFHRAVPTWRYQYRLIWPARCAWSSNARSWSFSRTHWPARLNNPLLLMLSPGMTPFSACR
jgi:hypothetical protein